MCSKSVMWFVNYNMTIYNTKTLETEINAKNWNLEYIKVSKLNINYVGTTERYKSKLDNSKILIMRLVQHTNKTPKMPTVSFEKCKDVIDTL